jgi:hypothetical protein
VINEVLVPAKEHFFETSPASATVFNAIYGDWLRPDQGAIKQG